MIVGLVGFIGSGKGTGGDILEHHGFHKLSFAGTVKDVTSVMFGWDRDSLEGDSAESRTWREIADPYWSSKFGRDFTPREALQKMGTEVGRNIFHTDFWVMSLENKIDKSSNYVITDVRFPNEIDFIHSQGGIVIEVQRGESPVWYTPLTSLPNHDLRYLYMHGFSVHESEWAWVGYDIDYKINNDKTVKELEKQLLSIIIRNEV